MKQNKTGRLAILLASIFALAAVLLPSAAMAKDSNKDRIPDRWEKQQKLSLKKDQRKLDQDKDGLRNRGEWLAGTDARDKDSDDDGTTDAKEQAGVVASYNVESQTLTIRLYAGGTIGGSVTGSTDVWCQDDDPSGNNPEEDSPEDQGDAYHGTDDDHGTEDDDDHGTEDDQGTEDDDGTEDGNDDSESDCSLDDLAVGVEITEANVKYTADGPVFTELEIVKVAAAA